MFRCDPFNDARTFRPGEPFHLGAYGQLDVPSLLERMAGSRERVELPITPSNGQQPQC